jgi:pimeloyl-ACP methyl ester carboxylesterase
MFSFSSASKASDKAKQTCKLNKYRKLALEYEKQLIALSGLTIHKDVEISDVDIDYLGDNYIHTITIGSSEKPLLVLLHGYMGNVTVFYRMLKQLSEHFHIRCIDFLGTGMSSRPDFKANTTDTVIEFFVDSVEKWRKALDIKTMHLAGHSLGGFIATHYALKYPECVHKLSLISPASITKGEDAEDLHEWGKTLSWRKDTFYKVFYHFFARKMTPQGLFTYIKFFGTKYLKQMIQGRLRRPVEETDLLFNYYFNMLQMPASSDKGVHYLIKPPNMCGAKPVEDEIPNLKIKVDFYYGDRDWMDPSGAVRLRDLDGAKYKLIVIDRAGHQVIFDNPEQLAERMIQNNKHAKYDSMEIIM